MQSGRRGVLERVTAAAVHKPQNHPFLTQFWGVSGGGSARGDENIGAPCGLQSCKLPADTIMSSSAERLYAWRCKFTGTARKCAKKERGRKLFLGEEKKRKNRERSSAMQCWCAGISKIRCSVKKIWIVDMHAALFTFHRRAYVPPAKRLPRGEYICPKLDHYGKTYPLERVNLPRASLRNFKGVLTRP